MADSKISNLSAATSLLSTDEFVIASSGTTKKITASDLASSLGWVVAGETWTYASADSPTFTFTVAADVTAKYSPGMRLKLTQTTVKYFIITAVSTFSGGNTTITVYGGTDYTLANAAITLPYFSTHKAPQGFPLDPAKWTAETTDTSDRTQASPTNDVWYNLGSLSLSIPIGIWRTYYEVVLDVSQTASDTFITGVATLSTANNSESDAGMTGWGATGGASSTNTRFISTIHRERFLTLTSKTSYFLNAKVNSGANSLDFRGDLATTAIRAVCAYL